MSISVVVIAHNEASSIERCLLSIQNQTMSPDEVILVAHNCSDSTATIARSFHNVTVIELEGEAGPAHARETGFRRAKGEVIASIDGDAIANPSWLKELTQPLADRSVSQTGGVVWLTGSIRGWLKSWYFFFLWPLLPDRSFHTWGANFACRRNNYLAVDGWRPFFALEHLLQLAEHPDDLYLTLALRRRGSIRLVRSAVVRTIGDRVPFARSKRQETDRKRLVDYFATTSKTPEPLSDSD